MKRFRSFLLVIGFMVPLTSWAGVYEDMLNAVNMKDIDKVSDLLQRGMDVNTTDPSGNSLLMLAAQNGDLPLLELILRNKPNILSINKYGDSALMLAALRGQLKSVVALVAAGANSDPDGWTPLIYASFGGHADVVRFLVALDIDIDAQADNGMTALMAASRNGHFSIVKILLENDADRNLVDQNKLTAMDMATSAGHMEIAREISRGRQQ